MDVSIIHEIRKTEKEADAILKDAESQKGKVMHAASDETAQNKEKSAKDAEARKQQALDKAKEEAAVEVKRLMADADAEASRFKEKASGNVSGAAAYVQKEFMKAIK